MRNALTFDIEEYFQVEAFRDVVPPASWPRLQSRVLLGTHRILDILEEHSVRATFFIVGWVAERHPALVRTIRERGHEVGCHGYAHLPIYAMSPMEFQDDLRRAKRAIEDAAGAAVLGYRAPTCSVVLGTQWALDVLREEGFRYDSSIFPIHHDRYGIPDAPRFPHRVPLMQGGDITEFPLTTLRIASVNFPFCGGGYFRLAPYALIRGGIRHVNRREAQPAIVYLHPWELDPEQPRFDVPVATRFRHYVNLRGTAAKLARLVADFDFAPARDVLADVGLLAVAA